MIEITIIVIGIVTFLIGFYIGKIKCKQEQKYEAECKKLYESSSYVLSLDDNLIDLYRKCLLEFKNKYNHGDDIVNITLKLEYREVIQLLKLIQEQAVFAYNKYILFLITEFILKDNDNELYELTFTRIEKYTKVIKFKE